MTSSLFSRRTPLLWIALSAILAAAFLPVSPAAAFQQTTVTGTVADAATGQPLAGVAVGVVGTGTATRTDAAGRYTIQAPGAARSPSAASGTRRRR
jgi:Zn-dependent protease